jgi:hypothetical protein
MCDSPSQFTTYGLDRPYELSEEHRKDDAPLLNQELSFGPPSHGDSIGTTLMRSKGDEARTRRAEGGYDWIELSDYSRIFSKAFMKQHVFCLLNRAKC